jgi:nucleoside-diphosphate-sugar epimerase
MRLLITGAAGFVGRHLITRARASEPAPELIAWTLDDPPAWGQGIRWERVDIRSPEAVRAAIARAAPTHVCHLAAAASVAGSFSGVRGTWDVNLMGTLSVLEGLAAAAADSVLLLVSSSEVYGRSFASGEPLDEDAPIAPMSPYAATKAACEMLARTFPGGTPRTLIARPFNHIGAGQSPQFALPAFARQLARIAAGRQAPELSVGNLDARRDFLDVDDVVRAYLAILSRAGDIAPGTAINICSGHTRPVGDLLAALIARSGLEVRVTQDPARMRPSDIPSAAGSNARARALLDWEPRAALEDTLDRILADWRVRAAAEAG